MSGLSENFVFDYEIIGNISHSLTDDEISALFSDDIELIKPVLAKDKNIVNHCFQELFLLDNGNYISRISTPLIKAVENNRHDVVDLLIENGVDIDFRIPGEQTALFYSVIKGHYDMVCKLLDNNADPNGSHRYTPLMAACGYGFYDIVKKLVCYGADPYIIHQNKYTAFGIAKETAGSENICKFLLEVFPNLDD